MNKEKSTYKTPGELLQTRFMKPMGLTQRELAQHLGCDIKVVNRIINKRTAVTPGMALRLAAVLKTTPRFWLDAQVEVDLAVAKKRLKRLPTPIKIKAGKA